MNPLLLVVLVVLVAAGVYVSLVRQSPFLSLALGVLVGGFIVALQARSKKP